MIKVYGFPRSGNTLLTHLIGANFYPDANLTSPPGAVGHWGDRQQVGPVEYGKLAGHHGPPSWGVEQPACYVFRDGRAVSASLYRSSHFKHPDNAATFSEFIRQPLDWQWTVGNRAENPSNVIDHWREHLSIWKRQSDVIAVQYEDLVRYPKCHLAQLAKVLRFRRPDGWTLPDKLVGWFPSGGKRTGWRELWNDEDDMWFFERVPKSFYGVMESVE